MKPVQFVGSPAVPGGLKVPEGGICTCTGREKRDCTWRFDSFAKAIDVFGLLDWHIAIPSKWTSTCGNSSVVKRSTTSVDWLQAQDYLDRPLHRITSKTAWTTPALECMLALCQESESLTSKSFLKVCERCNNIDRWTNQMIRKQNAYFKRALLIKSSVSETKYINRMLPLHHPLPPLR
jgi:hypothetical protein